MMGSIKPDLTPAPVRQGLDALFSHAFQHDFRGNPGAHTRRDHALFSGAAGREEKTTH